MIRHVTPPLVQQSKYRLDPSKRNIYCIFPADLPPAKLRFAEMLDISPEIE